MAKHWFTFGGSRRGLPRFLVIVGIGAFLGGASIPLLNPFAAADGGRLAVNPVASGLDHDLGLGAFPAVINDQLTCYSGGTAPAQLVTTTTSVHQPFHPQPVGQVAALLTPSLSRYFTLAPWPTLAPESALARVPILMYHDVLSEPEVFFDLTPDIFEGHLQTILANGLTPVSLDQVVRHLRTGAALPDKPVVLTFDDGYSGHYEHVFSLLKQYNVPAVFSIFPAKLDGDVVGRSTISWEQLKEMAQHELVTIAAHSVTHPPNLTQLDDAALVEEVTVSKQQLEAELGIPIEYFTYPAGHYDERVAQAVADAGYLAALTMRLDNEQFAGASESLLAIERFGQSNLNWLLEESWGGPPTIDPDQPAFNFATPVTKYDLTLDETPLTLIRGGRPVTIHANSRYQLPEILDGTNAVAAVDGAFFNLRYLDSNVMIGPVLSQSTRRFVPGNPSENPLLNGRPLVLISEHEVDFVPFDADQHNTITGIQQHMTDVTDAFVGAAWLVKDGVPQPPAAFGSLFDFDANRHRAFWGIDYDGRPVVGVSRHLVDSVTLGQLLATAGLREAVMLDSGASTSLTYQGESLVGYTPRPVPHAVALIPPHQVSGGTCVLTNGPNSAPDPEVEVDAENTIGATLGQRAS